VLLVAARLPFSFKVHASQPPTQSKVTAAATFFFFLFCSLLAQNKSIARPE